MWSWLFEPGLFSSAVVQSAALTGGLVAFTTGVVGMFTVIRRQAFAGEALGDIGATGGSGAFLLSVNPLWGFVVAALVAAGLIEAVGTKTAKSRDLATGVVLGGALGLAALFLYLGTTRSSTSGTPVAVLFGSLFVTPISEAPVLFALSACVLVVIAGTYRPLLLSTLSPDLARARGIPVTLVGLGYLLALAVSVALAALTVGAVLSTALLVGPPSTALRLVKTPGLAALTAGLTGMVATLLGVVLAYDSYYWPPAQHGWPVSFFIVAVIFGFYLLAGAATARHRSRYRSAPHTTVPHGHGELA